MKTYSEKLKDPRWQKRRLFVLNRDEFTCQCCDSTEKTLHVHHLYYVTNREPWDYPDWALTSLCYDCHKASHPTAAPDEDSQQSTWEKAVEFMSDGTMFWEDNFWDISMEFARLANKIGKGPARGRVLNFLHEEANK